MRHTAYITLLLIGLAAWQPRPLLAQLSISNIQWDAPVHNQDVDVFADVAPTMGDAISSVIINITVPNMQDILMQKQGTTSTYKGTIQSQAVGTVVKFKIKATEDDGDSQTSGEQSFKVKPTTPSNLKAMLDQVNGQINLTWNAVPEADSFDISYTIYRSLEPPPFLVLERGIDATSFVDDKIGNAQQLFYSVTAVHEGVESNLSVQASSQGIFDFAPFSIVGSRIDTLLESSDGIVSELRLNLSKLFSDDRPESLLFPLDPTFSDPLVTSADIILDSLVLTFSGEVGTINYNIVAVDAAGQEAMIVLSVTIDAAPTFVINEEEPQLGCESTMANENPPLEDEEVCFIVLIEDNNHVDRVEINLRRGGDSTFFKDDMTPIPNSNEYQYTIPAFAVSNRGVEYFLEAWDNNNFNSIAPNLKDDNKNVYSIEVTVPEPGVQKTDPQPASTGNANAYRLISMPLLLDNPNPFAVLADDLGKYKNSVWRFFEPDAAVDPKELVEFPNTGAMTPGKAFWLIVAESQSIDSGPGTTITTDQPRKIDLESGWNFIGNPFNFAIPLHRIISVKSDSINAQFFDGGWLPAVAADTLFPFEGIAVSNNSENMDQLLIYPSEELFLARTLPSDLRKAAQNEGESWTIDILAEAGPLRDTNQILLHGSASADWDPRDRPEPPVIGKYVTAYFPHDDWNKPLKFYSTDARPMPVEGELWELEVASNVAEPVELTFVGIDELPDGVEALLIDKHLQVTQRLSENNIYQVSSTSQQPQQLQVVIGTTSYTKEKEEWASLPTDDFQLLPNFPNPFRQTTTLPFQLAEESSVTLKIYNLLGERIATLMDGNSLQAGRHSFIWNGSNDAGQSVANGLYIIRFTAGTYMASRKILVLR